MIGGSAVWAALWIAWGPGGSDFDRSIVHPAPRSTWRVVRHEPDSRPLERAPDVPPPPLALGDEAGARIALGDVGPGPTGGFAPAVDRVKPNHAWPPEIAAAFDRLELARRAAVTAQPVESWRFDPVRAGYEGMLRTHRDDPAVQVEIQFRLADLGRLEEASRGARKIQAILDRSRARDRKLVATSEALAADERERSRTYRAIGMIQPSARRVEGRKLYALIGPNGSRRAYLDVPPGIDVDGLIARRVGVLGSVQYDEDLAARLITVRDVEELGDRR